MLQAQCAGLFGATANYRTEQSQSRGAQKAAGQDVGRGTAFLNDAIARIRADRQLDYDTAMSTLVPAVPLGRSKARDALAVGSTGPKSRWNYARSFCMDVAAASLLVAATATPAFAGDLVFPTRAASAMTWLARNQPYWALLAECAGVMGAASDWAPSRGDAAAAGDYERKATSMMGEAMHRLQVDRGLSEKDSMGYAAQQVYVGRDQGAQLLKSGTGAYSTFNIKRSACIEIDEAYYHENKR